MFFEEMNDLWTMPAGVTELDRKAEVARESFEKFPQRLTPILWREGGRQLNQDDLKLWFKQLDRTKKGSEFGVAIAQTADVGDFSRKLAGKAKCSGGVFDPAPHNCFPGRSIKGGIDLNGGKIMRIKFQPARRGQIGRIKVSSPFLKTPRASAEPDFLLCGEIQWTLK